MKHDDLAPSDTFVHRHIGPAPADIEKMLKTLGVASLEELVSRTIPSSIRVKQPLALAPSQTEHATSRQLRAMAEENDVFKSYIGMGYADTITPAVILRNVLENPGYYTQYTPYQAEISQGRLEALVNFQTMVADLCGMTLSNASLLDEGTAAAEAMTMCQRIGKSDKKRFFVADDCNPQTIAVVATRARALGIEVDVAAPDAIDFARGYFGILLSYPSTDGRVVDPRALVQRAHDAGALVSVVTDLLFLTLFASPGEIGADIAVGSSQRFGVPLGFGGPHAAFIATDEKHSRFIPGRIIGASKDARGKPAFRLALQTREQHIRRDRATSNICTAQVLLAIVASMYAVYHGPEGLKRIATRVRGLTHVLRAGLAKLGLDTGTGVAFDTLRVKASVADGKAIVGRAVAARVNLRVYPGGDVGVALDETTTVADVDALLAVFAGSSKAPKTEDLSSEAPIPSELVRATDYLTHPVFNTYKSETDMLRYIRRLESRDLSLITSMISLGSCTMKLNATSEMLPISWPHLNRIHPFAPKDQTKGYQKLVGDLEAWLSEITGFAATSLQPNAGAQGEYAGLLVIRAYHERRGDTHRDVCLIPVSAHGTNPASAALAGMRVVIVACDERGNVDLADLEKKATEHAKNLSCLMITYPSTHGVFEESIRKICDIVHGHGGQVYMDGANMNAQVGLCRPGDFGADVCHLNLHKTFCIPHGGGGPGMGPICVAKHLAPHLPMHPLDFSLGGKEIAPIGPVSAAPNGSASILPIPWMYIAMMGVDGLTKATQVAILNANYMQKRLEKEFDILYRGDHGYVAHEFIVDCRPFKKSAGIEVEDIAKRLIDYGFHAPTMSFPVPGTLMIEPTESEPLAELDRFCDAMLSIRQEIREIEAGTLDRADNPLKNAPHTADAVTGDTWNHAYSRTRAAYPAPWLRDHKFWPHVARVDNAYGDRNLVCTCLPIEAYQS